MENGNSDAEALVCALAEAVGDHTFRTGKTPHTFVLFLQGEEASFHLQSLHEMDQVEVGRVLEQALYLIADLLGQTEIAEAS